jgi:hypothetical protein
MRTAFVAKRAGGQFGKRRWSSGPGRRKRLPDVAWRDAPAYAEAAALAIGSGEAGS